MHPWLVEEIKAKHQFGQTQTLMPVSNVTKLAILLVIVPIELCSWKS